jgi:hypothetical protein
MCQSYHFSLEFLWERRHRFPAPPHHVDFAAASLGKLPG